MISPDLLTKALAYQSDQLALLKLQHSIAKDQGESAETIQRLEATISSIERNQAALIPPLDLSKAQNGDWGQLDLPDVCLQSIVATGFYAKGNFGLGQVLFANWDFPADAHVKPGDHFSMTGGAAISFDQNERLIVRREFDPDELRAAVIAERAKVQQPASGIGNYFRDANGISQGPYLPAECKRLIDRETIVWLLVTVGVIAVVALFNLPSFHSDDAQPNVTPQDSLNPPREVAINPDRHELPDIEDIGVSKKDHLRFEVVSKTRGDARFLYKVKLLSPGAGDLSADQLSDLAMQISEEGNFVVWYYLSEMSMTGKPWAVTTRTGLKRPVTPPQRVDIERTRQEQAAWEKARQENHASQLKSWANSQPQRTGTAEPCPACKGTGNGPFLCFFCKGKGVPRGSSFPCNFCNGRGVAKCLRCNGAGKQ